MFVELMQALFSTLQGTAHQPMTDYRRFCLEAEGKSELNAAPADMDDGQQPENPYTGEIKRLEDALFDGHPLQSGLCIDITLQDLLEICPRKRRRKDAYRSLQRELSDMGVTLNIKSRKDGKEKD
jgi:hypothetical protein